MKRKNSRATFYRKIKRGITTCLDLSQGNSSIHISDQISDSQATATENLRDFQIAYNEIDNSNNSDHFNNSYDSSTQFSDTFNDVIDECNVPAKENVTKTNNENTFINELRSWAISYKIPHNALKELLKILQSQNITLPSDPRTLLCTPRRVCYKSVTPGVYSHIGIKTAIADLFKLLDKRPEKINLLINIDGLPLSKSSSSQIYPILCLLSECPQYVSVIGIYHGYGKPNNANDFLSDFTVEAIKLSEEGFTYDNQNIPFAIKAFICDAPAKSFITYCKSHTGFFSCTKCMQKGKYIKGRVCYPNINSNKRTDENFRNKVQVQHHIGTSILENIPSVDMVRSFSLEYMHLICLGVIKKLIVNIWLFGPAPHKLPRTHIQDISNYLIQIKPYISCDFVRKTRSLDEVKRWKATEFRFFYYIVAPLF